MCAQLGRQSLPQRTVERAHRLVEHQQARLGRQGTRQRHPLLLPTRQLVDGPSLGARQADELEHLRHACRRRRAPASPRIRRPNATLSPTSRCGNRAKSWNISPKPRSWVGTAVMSRPSNQTRPAAGGSRPATARSRLDLPEPLGPRRLTISPGATARSTESSAVRVRRIGPSGPRAGAADRRPEAIRRPAIRASASAR